MGLEGQISVLGRQISGPRGLMGEGGEMGDKQTDEKTNKQTNGSPPVFYKTLSPSGALPKQRNVHVVAVVAVAKFFDSSFLGCVSSDDQKSVCPCEMRSQCEHMFMNLHCPTRE